MRVSLLKFCSTIALLSAISTVSSAALVTEVVLAPGANSPDATKTVSGTTTAEGSLTSSFGSSIYDASGKASADYGVLKTYAELSLENYPTNSYSAEGCGGFGCYIADPVYVTAGFTDTLVITGGSGTGYLLLKFDVDGTTSKKSDLGPISTVQGALLVYANSALAINTGFFGGSYKFTSALVPFTYGTPFTLDVSQFAFSVVVDIASETGGNPYDHSGTADFFNTTTLTGLSVYSDPSMKSPVSTFAVGASSGTAYPTSSISAVPEPSTLAMVSAGFAFAWRLRKRKA